MFRRKQTETVSKEYTPAERQAIALDVVDFIRKRTAEGKDKNNKTFKKYSKAYKQSNEFKEANKSGRVNLKLSGDMMSELDPLPSRNGEVSYGYEKGSAELGKAEGHVTGVLGKSSGHKRDFLGISKQDFRQILSRYPLKNRGESKGRARLISILQDLSEKEAALQAKELVAAGTVTMETAQEYYRDQYGKEFE